MKMRWLVALATLAVAAGGGGAALAASQSDSSPEQDAKAYLHDVADRLGVSDGELRDAMKGATSDRIDEAVADGRISEKEGDAIKERIDSGELPFPPVPFLLGHRGAGFGGPGFGLAFGGPGFGPPFGELGGPLDSAADYLGLTDAELRDKLTGAKTLADVAEGSGKSVDGLKSAIKDDLEKQLGRAVDSGRLTSDQEQRILDGFDAHLDDLVNGKPPVSIRFRGPMPAPPPPGGIPFGHIR